MVTTPDNSPCQKAWRPSRRLILGSIAAISIVAIIVVIGYAFALRTYREQRCKANLRAISDTINLYRNENSGCFPPDLKTLADTEGFDTPEVGCPGRPSGSGTVPGAWFGYVLIDWSTQPRGPDWSKGKYPVIYDAFMSNHEGRGIHILMVDGTVQWNPSATWLKQFAAQHENVSILIPN